MIRSDRFVEELRRAGIDFFTGVPCSYLTALIDELIGDAEVPFVAATNEGDAVAIACGAELGGRRAVVFFQNSGLGNAVNPLTSLCWTFRIPALVVTTWRGRPGGPADEPQHELMGAITPALLDAMEIPWALFPEDEAQLASVLRTATEHMDRTGRPYALIVPKGAVGGDRGRTATPERAPSAEVPPAPASAAEPLDPDEALRRLAEVTAEDAVLTTTGFTGRALFAQVDRANQLYMVGSMGCVSSLALGLAVARPDRRVVAVDGDGAFLMRMGALATVGYERPPNLVHVLLDNGVHDSTGAQSTVSRSIDPVGVARACGYPRALRVDTAEELARAVQSARDGLTFVHARTLPRADRKLPRPSIRPHEVAERLRAWLRA